MAQEQVRIMIKCDCHYNVEQFHWFFKEDKSYECFFKNFNKTELILIKGNGYQLIIVAMKAVLDLS